MKREYTVRLRRHEGVPEVTVQVQARSSEDAVRLALRREAAQRRAVISVSES